MANYPARSSGDQTINYLRAPITFAIGLTGVVQIGTLPAGCAILRAYVVNSVVFNPGATPNVKIGTPGNDASIVASVAVSALGVTAGTIVASAAALPTVDTPVIVTSLMTTSAPTTGAGVVVIEYAPVA